MRGVARDGAREVVEAQCDFGLKTPSGVFDSALGPRLVSAPRESAASAVFLKGKPPENMTLHGAHDFNSGGEIGSVSAASSAFATHIGKQFERVVNTLTVG